MINETPRYTVLLCTRDAEPEPITRAIMRTDDLETARAVTRDLTLDDADAYIALFDREANAFLEDHA